MFYDKKDRDISSDVGSSENKNITIFMSQKNAERSRLVIYYLFTCLFNKSLALLDKMSINYNL